MVDETRAARTTARATSDPVPEASSGERGVENGVVASQASGAGGAPGPVPAAGGGAPGPVPAAGGGAGAPGSEPSPGASVVPGAGTAPSLGVGVGVGVGVGAADDGVGRGVGDVEGPPSTTATATLPELEFDATSRWTATIRAAPRATVATHDHRSLETIAWQTEAEPTNTVTVAPFSPVPENRTSPTGRVDPSAGVETTGGTGAVRSSTIRTEPLGSDRTPGANGASWVADKR
jgi:hypothetical protein